MEIEKMSSKANGGIFEIIDSLPASLNKSGVFSELADKYLRKDDEGKIQGYAEHLISTGIEEFPLSPFTQLDAIKFLVNYVHNPLTVSSIARIDPLPHQIEAFLKIIAKSPIRMLIADDVGLGKTIEVGMVLKELILRKEVVRVLIIVPPTLSFQWVEELDNKFGLTFKLLFGAIDEEEVRSNEKIVISLDTIKQKKKLEIFTRYFWDMVIFDEAHKLTPGTARYEVAEGIRSNHLLLLSATPHDGKTKNFKKRLSIIDREFEDIPDDMISVYLANCMLRRTKGGVKDFQGKFIFPARPEPNTLEVKHKFLELEFYAKAEMYIQEYYLNPETREKFRNVIFILLVFMRRISSSLYSGIKSLHARLSRVNSKLGLPVVDFSEVISLDDLSEKFDNLEVSDFSVDMNFIEELEVLKLDVSPGFEGGELEEFKMKSVSDENFEEVISNITDAPDDDRERVEQKIVEHVEGDEVSLEDDRNFLSDVINLGVQILNSGIDSKFNDLKALIRELRSKNPSDKIIIFTEFRDTLIYLAHRLARYGYRITTIWGSTIEEKERKLVEFEERSDLLIGTDAASEGLNLQFANVVINYELPWNPNKLEQRIGRVYRYNQTKDIYVSNFTSSFDVEARILSKLYEKLENIKEALDEPGIDILGTMISEHKIGEVIAKAFNDPREASDDLDVYLDDKKNLVSKMMHNYFVSGNFDLPDVFRGNNSIRFISEYDLENFILSCLAELGVIVRIVDKDGQVMGSEGSRLDSATFHEVSMHEVARQLDGELEEILKLPGKFRFTFDRRVRLPKGVDFIAYGHPLVTALTVFKLKKLRSGIVIDPNSSEFSILRPFQLLVKNVLGDIIFNDVFILDIDASGKEEFYSTSRIWDYRQVSASLNKERRSKMRSMVDICSERFDDERIKVEFVKTDLFKQYDETVDYLVETRKSVNKSTLDQLERPRSEKFGRMVKESEKSGAFYLADEYKVKQAAIMSRALEASDRIEKAFDRDKFKLEVVKLPFMIFKLPVLQEFLDTLRNPFPELFTEEEFRKSRKYYSDANLAEMVKKKHAVDRAGMALAMAYERREGRAPRDVSHEPVGYDIYSEDGDRKRYIELKSFSMTGDIQITPNEWRVARLHPKLYTLYVATHVLDRSKSEVHNVGNPVELFGSVVEVREKVEIRYTIPWKVISERLMEVKRIPK